jgi:hypothetical protein
MRRAIQEAIDLCKGFLTRQRTRSKAMRDRFFRYADVRAVVEKRFGPLVRGLRDLSSKGCELFADRAKDGWLLRPGDPQVFYRDYFLIGSLRQAIILLEATALLLENGLTHAGRIIVRPLFEMLVNAKYILSKPDDPLAQQLFYSSKLDHEKTTAATLTYARKLAPDDERLKLFEAQHKRVREEIAKLEADIGSTVEKRRATKWSKKSLRDLAEAVDLEDEYDAHYRELCWDVHGTLAAFHFTKKADGGMFVARDFFDIQDSPYVAAKALGWALELMEVICEAWAMDTGWVDDFDKSTVEIFAVRNES